MSKPSKTRVLLAAMTFCAIYYAIMAEVWKDTADLWRKTAYKYKDMLEEEQRTGYAPAEFD